MTAPADERLALALTGVEYFMSCVWIDLEDDDREKLRDHMSHLRQSVITALQSLNESLRRRGPTPRRARRSAAPPPSGARARAPA